jgi:hypothetical protein
MITGEALKGSLGYRIGKTLKLAIGSLEIFSQLKGRRIYSLKTKMMLTM